MKGRRRFISFCSAMAVSLFAVGHASRKFISHNPVKAKFVGPPAPVSIPATAATLKTAVTISGVHPDSFVIDNLASNISSPPDLPPSEVVLNTEQLVVFESVRARLSRLQRYVGYGNFNVISWDQSLRFAAGQTRIGAFPRVELDFIESLFFTKADTLGFYGDKVVSQLSAAISKKDIVKIPASGHYLFKGEALDTYRKIRKDVGDSIVLTSGIRSVVKQIYLFLNKAASVDGNLSLASYSLAPPGHSYHAIGDFDVGKRGYGSQNFSAAFASTDEFKRLADLGYVAIRYPPNNPFGVRYEPWHVKVV